MMMVIKLVGGIYFEHINTYASQANLEEEVKKNFWEDLDEVVRGIPFTEKLLT